MPNLGPFGEALGKAISPALDAAGKRLAVLGDSAAEAAAGAVGKVMRAPAVREVLPVAAKQVEKLSGGTRELVQDLTPVPIKGNPHAGVPQEELLAKRAEVLANLQDVAGRYDPDYKPGVYVNTGSGSSSSGGGSSATPPSTLEGVKNLSRQLDDLDKQINENRRAAAGIPELRERSVMQRLGLVDTNKDATRQYDLLKKVGEWGDSAETHKEKDLRDWKEGADTSALTRVRPLLLSDRFTNPQNRPEVEANLKLIQRVAGLVRYGVPKSLYHQLPPSVQGVVHLLGGRGETLDYGLTVERVRSDEKLKHDVAASQLAPMKFNSGNFANFITAARNMLAHPEFSDVKLEDVIPMNGLGMWENALGKCFLIRNSRGGYDLVDDYRFFDHKEKHTDVMPMTLEDTAKHSIGYVNNWRGAKSIVSGAAKTGVKTIVGTDRIKAAAKALIRTKNPAMIRMGKQLATLAESNWRPGQQNVDYYIDKMLVDMGTPYPVRVKDFDKIWAAARADASSPAENHLQVFHNEVSQYETMGEWAQRMGDGNSLMRSGKDYQLKKKNYFENLERAQYEKDKFMRAAGNLVEKRSSPEPNIGVEMGPIERAQLKWLLTNPWRGKRELIAMLGQDEWPTLTPEDILKILPERANKDVMLDLAPFFANEPGYNLSRLDRADMIASMLHEHGHQSNYRPASYSGEVNQARTAIRNAGFNPHATLTPMERATLLHMRNANHPSALDASSGEVEKYFESLPGNEKQIIRNASEYLLPSVGEYIKSEPSTDNWKNLTPVSRLSNIKESPSRITALTHTQEIDDIARRVAAVKNDGAAATMLNCPFLLRAEQYLLARARHNYESILTRVTNKYTPNAPSKFPTDTAAYSLRDSLSQIDSPKQLISLLFEVGPDGTPVINAHEKETFFSILERDEESIQRILSGDKTEFTARSYLMDAPRWDKKGWNPAWDSPDVYRRLITQDFI